MAKIKEKLRTLWLFGKSKVFPPEIALGTLIVTRRCDRECDYCHTRENHNPEEELSTSESKTVIDRFKELGVWYFAVYGGEPTLRADLPEIIRQSRERGMISILHTNGSFKNVGVEEVVNAGINIIDFAVDSVSNPHLKNYYGVMGNLEKAIKLDVGVKLNLCITKNNASEVKDVLQLSKDYRIPISIHLGEAPVLPTNTVIDKSRLFQVGNEEGVQHVDELARFLSTQARINPFILNSPEYFDAWSAFIRSGKSDWNCRAGETSLVVDYNGAILPCVSSSKPIKVNGRVMRYTDTNKSTIADIKNSIGQVSEECNSGCLSCAYMLEDSFSKHPLRMLKAVASF